MFIAFYLVILVMSADGIRIQSTYKLIPVDEALQTIIDHIQTSFHNNVGQHSSSVAVTDAMGLIIAEDILSSENVPPFRASIMDGFAIVASDGPGEYPVLNVVTAGQYPTETLTSGKIYRITTGSPLPEGADAVVPIEQTLKLSNGLIKIENQAQVNQHIRAIGSDIAVGEVVMTKGARIGPSEIGILTTLGITHVKVYSRPRVAILSTGDELVPFGTKELANGYGSRSSSHTHPQQNSRFKSPHAHRCVETRRSRNS